MARSKTGRNILGGLVAAAVITAGVGAVTWSAVGRLSRAMDDLVDRAYPAVLALVELDAGVGEARRSLNGMTSDRYMTDRALRDALRKRLESGLARIAAARADFEAHADLDAAEQARWRTVTAGLDAWLAAVAGFSTQAWARPPDSAEPPVDDALWRAFLGLREKHDRFAKPLAEALAAAREHAVLDRGAAQAGARRDIALVAVLVLLGAAATVAVGLWLARRADRVVAALRAQAGALRDAVRQGKLDVRGDPSAVERDFRPVVEGMNETMDAFAKPIAVTADYVTRIARGDLPPPIAEEYAGDFDRIKVALNGCIASLSALTGDLQAMTRDQLAGDHEAYVEPARFEGTYRALAEGVRANVKHHVDSVFEILQTVQAYADGDFSRTVRRFPGKQAVAHETVDAVRGNLRAVAAEVRALTEATLAGRLGVRADAARLRGDWAALVKGVNDALDAIVGPFRIVAEYCDRISHGDLPPRRTKEVPGELAAIQASLNRCLDAVGALVTDAEGLAEAAVAGRLATRADASRHEGAFRAAIDGVNRTLDAVVAPVNEAAGVLERLARRDLTVRVRGDHRGDHARIQDAVNATAEALHDALAQVAAAVEQVSSAAAQIAASSQAVAAGASEQASSLEETSSSIDSVAGMTRGAADSAQQANGLARSARTAATEGAAAVEQMQGAMSRIKASSEGTSQIIKDVSEIAFQTNLLALNAAVEAARAGEAGRGFAVVAEEVRSLALRAKEAATKTEGLIRQSVKEANEGEQSARHVAGKLEEIVGGVSKVTAVVEEIAASAREQSAGIEQVTRAVAEMDKVTQQNAASAEESSSAASELSGQAEELAAMVGAFRLERGAGAARLARAS